MLVLIISWGAYVQASNPVEFTNNTFTDIGGLIFLIFSVAYFGTSYYLYKFNVYGKIFFIPLVILFVVQGFTTEFLNPSQFSKDILYLIIFYLVSPILFVSQGVVIAILFLTEINDRFVNHSIK
jgi:hypothetical protein